MNSRDTHLGDFSVHLTDVLGDFGDRSERSACRALGSWVRIQLEVFVCLSCVCVGLC
jgi:hypothetical protein